MAASIPFHLLAATLLASAAAPAIAAPELRMLVAEVGRPDADGTIPVEIVAANGGSGTIVQDVPARIAGELAVAGARTAVTLERAEDQPTRVRIAAGGFATLRFQFRPAAASGSAAVAILSLPSVGVRGVAVDLPPMPHAQAVEVAWAEARTVPATSATVVQESFASADADSGNAFLGNLSAYEPVYAVYGPGTNSDARIQISFKYQLFGQPGAGRSWLEGLNFGYTQRLFWDLGRKSSPFHNVDYMPEFFYLFPARPVGDVLTLGGQIGIRHESNGRDGAASRTINTLYVQPIATMPIGSYKLTVGPRLWTYLGSLSDNPDAKRFRGNTGLMAEIGSDDGMRLSTTTRLNPGSGKGSFNAELSYPLDRLTHSDLNFYLFGQAFTGFGENLLDYDRRQTRFRIGVGMVR